MTDFEDKIIHSDNWEQLSFAMLRSKEFTPAAKGALRVWMHMPAVQAAQEAQVLYSLMHARLLKEIEKRDAK